jgi:hypothetical protein
MKYLKNHQLSNTVQNAQPKFQLQLAELALISRFAPAGRPPVGVSKWPNLAWLLKVSLLEAQTEDDLHFFCKWKTTSILL